MNYLKNLVMIIDSEALLGPCKQGIMNLTKENLSCTLYRKENFPFSSMTHDVYDKSLFMTDCSETARFLLENNYAVLVYLAPHNQNQDFSGVTYACEDFICDVTYYENVYRRYHLIPWDICESKRCFLRESTVEDVDAFYEIYKEPSITEYMEDLFDDPMAEKRYMKQYISNVYGLYGFGVWTVILKETGEIIGRVGLSYRDGYDEAELGFVIGVPWQKKGLAFETCQAVMQYGFEELGFEKIQALVEPGNIVSVTLCQKLGFHQESLEHIGQKDYLRFLTS